MRIVDRKTFLAMPPETLFSKYEPCVFGPLCIKGTSYTDDFLYQDLADAVEFRDSGQMLDDLEAARTEGKSLRMDFDCQGRDGLFDAEQLFAIWEQADVAALISRLTRCIHA